MLPVPPHLLIGGDSRGGGEEGASEGGVLGEEDEADGGDHEGRRGRGGIGEIKDLKKWGENRGDGRLRDQSMIKYFIVLIFLTWKTRLTS